jgi:hypothetical protein
MTFRNPRDQSHAVYVYTDGTLEKRALTVDRDEQTAPGIELALKLFLDNNPASWVHLR